MALFAPLYARVMRWSAHPHASGYLAALSFMESSFFPVPVDVMLAPMVVARPAQARRLAILATIASVLGGVFGWILGAFAFELIDTLLVDVGYMDEFRTAESWFKRWGFWVVLLAGFSPIPYKVFTIAAGTLSMPLLPFILASLIGRGARFFLVAGFIAWAGPKVEPLIRRYIEWLGWGVVLLAGVVYLWLQFANG